MDSLPYGFTLNVYHPKEFPGSAKNPKIKNAPKDTRELFARYFEGMEDHDDSKDAMYPCPLHRDDTPSCSVHVEKGVFHCHASSCGARGTAIDLFRRMEGLDYQTAKKALKHLNIASDAYYGLAADYLRTRMLPLYVDNRELVVRVLEGDDPTGATLSVPMASQAKMEATLAPIMGDAPCSLLGTVIGDDLPTQALEKVLKEAILSLSGGLPTAEELVCVGPGLHVTNWGPRNDGHVILVDGKDLLVWDDSTSVVEDAQAPTDGLFEELEDLLAPIVDRRKVQTYKNGTKWRQVAEYPYLGEFLPVGTKKDTWFPWSESPSPVLKTPAQLLKRLVEMLSTGWVWSDPSDPILVALYTMYAPIFTAWDTPPLQMHVTGPSQSGKSALSAGWFGGKLAGSVQMAPGMRYYHDASAAGIRQELNFKRQGIVLDELLDTNSSRMTEVVELMRGMETNQGSKTLRGTRDGKSRAYDISAPVVWSSISAGGLTQDVNRRIAIEFRRVSPPPMEPWRAMTQRWSIEEMRQTARSVAEMLIPHLADLKTRTEAVQAHIKNSPSGGFRTLNRIMPLIAIADLCGQDIQKLFRGITAKVEDLENMLSGTEPREEVRHALLFTKIPVEQGPHGVYLPLSHFISEGLDLDCPEYGLFYDSEKDWVGVNPTAFLKIYKNHNYSGITLGRLFKDMPGYRKQGRKETGGSFARVTFFEGEALMGAEVTAG